MKTEPSWIWRLVDRFLVTVAVMVVICGASFTAARLIGFPNNLRHEAAHFESLPTFAKLTLRAK